MRSTLTVLFALSMLLSGCNAFAENASAIGIPSPTPFQPGDANASDSLYAGAAPTPIFLPEFTPPPLAPTEVVIAPETLPEGLDVPAFTLPASLNPLTGLPPADPYLLERHPLAIKVANYPRYIRPQSGLTLADNVFEYYIEGGLTRFIAVFYGNNSEWVGPVRSGRFFDEHIARMYQAYLIFKFADPRVLDYFRTTDFSQYLVIPTSGSCPPYRTMPNRNIEVYNNSYFNTVRWEECVIEHGLDNRRPYLRNGFFSDSLPPQSDLPGTRVFTYYSEYSYNYWLYVPESGQYARYQETDDIRNGKLESYAPMLDAVTATAVHASNVVVLMAYHTFSNPFDQDDEVYHIDLTGSGEAYVFRDGAAIPARWHRTNKDQPLLLTGPNGAPIYMKPGITFYEVIGVNSYAAQGEGEWYFHHATP